MGKQRYYLIFSGFYDKLFHMDIKHKIEGKVFSFIEEHHMLQNQDKVVAGISGGADSVCLLFVLLEYRKKVPFSLAVVHVNHGIRSEAGEDARYVEELCKQKEIPFYLFEKDVRQMAEQEKCSEEEAGRKIRYQAFSKVAQEYGANKIAVAHNCNDRCETMLFHLFRGSGIKGLGSIRPIRDNIIRPILCLERSQVEAYLSERGIAFCRDATNEEDDYTRNRIRHHILPYAEQEIVSGCVGHMSHTADLLADTDDYLEQQTREAMKFCVQLCGPRRETYLEQTAADTASVAITQAKIQITEFLTFHKVIRQRILYKVITALAASEKDISAVHVKDLMTLFAESGNRSISLPYGLVGRRQYDQVIVESRSDTGDATKDEVQLQFTILSTDTDLRDFPSNQYTKWFDYDKIEKPLVLRTRKTGDYLTIAGKDGQIRHKSVKDYMIAEKIPKQERDKIPLLADGDHVIWLVGYRISEYYKINRNTKHILQVQLIGKSCDGNRTEEKNG